MSSKNTNTTQEFPLIDSPSLVENIPGADYILEEDLYIFLWCSPLTSEVVIDYHTVTMEVDTGAATSVISEYLFMEL